MKNRESVGETGSTLSVGHSAVLCGSHLYKIPPSQTVTCHSAGRQTGWLTSDPTARPQTEGPEIQLLGFSMAYGTLSPLIIVSDGLLGMTAQEWTRLFSITPRTLHSLAKYVPPSWKDNQITEEVP